MYTCVYLFDSAVDERSLSLSLSHTHTLSLSLGESVLTDSKQISNAFNNHFSSIGPKINKGVQPTSVSPESYVQPTTSQLEFKLIDVSEVHSFLSGFSVMDPFLFLIYINDLPNCLESTTPSLYADDTQITAEAETVADLEHLLDKDMHNLSTWLSANKLSQNASKTEFIVIASDHRSKIKTTGM